MDHFYLYRHVRNSDGLVFYIGKGMGRRAWCRTTRSRKWKDFVSANPDWRAEITHTGLSETAALALEIATIAEIGLDNLCNLSRGGHGLSGYRFTAEQKARVSEAHIGIQAGEKHPLFGKPKTNETRQKISAGLAGNKNRGTTPLSAEAKARISASRKGKTAGEKHPQYDSTVRSFHHCEHGVFQGTAFALRQTYGLPQSGLSAVVRGAMRHCHGWVLLP